jgi:hypothetical protein
MAYTIGKRMVTLQPRANPQPGGAPSFATGLPKAGSVLTMLTGVWDGHPPFNPRFQWYSGVSSIANATNSTFSIHASSAGNYFLTCRQSMGNSKWGTVWRDFATGTIMP